MPVAATSLPMIITRHNQYVYRATNPAHGPKNISAYNPNDPAAGCSTAISASAHITVSAITAPAAKLKITAGPASFTLIALPKKSPVPIVQPRPIIATCRDDSRLCKPASRLATSRISLFDGAAAVGGDSCGSAFMALHRNKRHTQKPNLR